MRNGSGRTTGWFLIIAAITALYLAILVGVSDGGKAGAQAGPTAQPTLSTDPNDYISKGSVYFAPVTIADFGPVTTNAAMPGKLAVSGDWVAYTETHIVCGHCGYVAAAVYGHNIVTGKLVRITGSTQAVGNSDSRVGIADIALHGNILTWTQPDPGTTAQATPVTSGNHSAVGPLACTSCYYNLAKDTGGAWTGGPFPQDLPIDYTFAISPYDPANDSQQTITVTQKSTGVAVLNATFKGYWKAGNVVLDSNKMVFVQSQSGYGVPQLLRVAWILGGDPAFTNVWTKADAPVAARKAQRSWLWGPGQVLTRYEQYLDGKNGQRLVQYYDKSRMEINNPAADPNGPGYVTNGLLTVEMISGEIQIGDITRIEASVPCTIPVAGDPRKDNPLTPSYADLLGVATIHGENQAASRTGQAVDDSLDASGIIGKDATNGKRTKYAVYAAETKHNIPDVFWKYMSGMKATYGFDWTFVLGYPITEAYWTQMRVGGRDMPVLIQAYQRRVLTYIPGFEPVWQVQQGNVGRHYLEWTTRNNTNRLATPDIVP